MGRVQQGLEELQAKVGLGGFWGFWGPFRGFGVNWGLWGGGSLDPIEGNLGRFWVFLGRSLGHLWGVEVVLVPMEGFWDFWGGSLGF